jgi:hypothetical protein
VGPLEGLSQLPLVVLRPLAEPIGDVVLDAAVRQPDEDARVSTAQAHDALTDRRSV